MKYYVCQACGQDFEAINPNGCPFCGSMELSMDDIGGTEAVDYYYSSESEGQEDY